MSSSDEYLKQLLRQQAPPAGVNALLQEQRKYFEGIIRAGIDETDVRFYYAGSYRKETMIKESFDLDIVIYFPPTTRRTLSEIYYDIRSILQRHNLRPRTKNVALQCDLWDNTYGAYHIDVVPGKAKDVSYEDAYLYKSKDDSRLLTNIFVHVDAVRGTRHRDVIKLLKLWKLRKGFSCPTFILEMLFIRYSNTLQGYHSLTSLLIGCFKYIADHIHDIRLVDPANSYNIVSDDLSFAQKEELRVHARRAYDATQWGEVFGS